MPNRVRLLTVVDADRAELLRWSRGRGASARVAERARIALLARQRPDRGRRSLGGPAALSRLWSGGAASYAGSGLADLEDLPRGGGPVTVPTEDVDTRSCPRR